MFLDLCTLNPINSQINYKQNKPVLATALMTKKETIFLGKEKTKI